MRGLFKTIASLLLIGARVQAQSNCHAVTFNVSGSALNRNITGSIPVGNITALLAAYDSAALIPVSGPQILAGTYCTPTTRNSNNAKLQVLIGSITVSRGGWSAQGGVGTNYSEYEPDQYSWVQFANAKGYPTLALDKLGTGLSSHPDPILVVQAPYEISLYSNLAKQIRKGQTQLRCNYDYLIYVGNSYGSQLGASIAGQAPQAYDEFILTGFTNSVQKGLPGVLLTDAAPAQVVDPAQFGNLPVGYLTTSSQQGRTNSFFGSHAQVSYTDTVSDLFFARKDVVSVGQFASVYAYPFNGTGFAGRVLVLDGEEDQPFCGPGSPVIGPAQCGSQLKQTGVLFSTAQYNYKAVNKIGHAVQLFLRSQTLFTVAHEFLAGQNFAGGPPA